MAKLLIEAIAYDMHILPEEQELKLEKKEKKEVHADNLGWVQYDVKVDRAIEKAHKTLCSMFRALRDTDEQFFESLKLEMYNHRKEGKDDFFDRIKLYNDSGFNYLILYKYHGMGAYAVYRMSGSEAKPNKLIKSHIGTLSGCIKTILSDFGR